MDASASGALLSFPEPVGLPPGARVCISVDAGDGVFHLMADVVRVARGEDFHTYVGVAVDRPERATSSHDHDLARWRRWLDETAGDETDRTVVDGVDVDTAAAEPAISRWSRDRSVGSNYGYPTG